jgi:hypothetical protein
MRYEFGKSTPASMSGPGVRRTIELTSTSTFGIVYDADPRKVVVNGSTVRQFRGFGLSMSTTLAQRSVTSRPVLVPPWNTSPLPIRALPVTSTPFQ